MRKYTEDQIELARTLYLEYKSPTSISQLTGVDRSTIYYYINRSWEAERSELALESLKNIRDGKDSKMVDIIDSGLDIIRRNLKQLELSKRALNVSELKTITSIMTDVDKVRKLDKKKATSISAVEDSGQTSEETVLDPFVSGTESEKEEVQ